jgi:hypothetical protein
LGGTNVTGRGLSILKPLAKLERLNLQGCKRLRDDAAAVLAGFSQLKVLDLKDSSLSPEAVAKIHAALPGCDLLN